MSVDVMRLWRDRLRDPSEGINARLLTLPRDATDPAPAPVSVVEETQYFWTPGAKIPNRILEEEAPFVLIARASPETMATAPSGAEIRDGNDEVDLVALYVGFASAAPRSGAHELMRDAMYAMRAARRSTEEWLRDMSQAAYEARCRNDVQIVGPLRATVLNLAYPLENAFVGAGYLLSLEVNDRWANAIT
jgi:hypothetical protein